MAGTTHSYPLNRYATHAMATQATSADETKTTDHHSVNLVKQYNTCYQQSSNFQRWNSASSEPFGLEKTQQQEKLSWELATKSSEKEQLDACQSLTSMTSKCLTSSAEQKPMMAPAATSQSHLQPRMVLHPPRRSTTTTETQTSKEQMPITPSPAGGQQIPPRAIADAPMASTAPALANSPMATAYSCEDLTEQQTEQILLGPIVITDGLDKQKTIQGISMKQQQVYMEVDIESTH